MNKVQEVLVNIWSQFTDSSEQNIEDLNLPDRLSTKKVSCTRYRSKAKKIRALGDRKKIEALGVSV